MIGVHALRGGVVSRVLVVETLDAARSALRALEVPAVACDGAVPLGASGHTTAADLAVILAAVRPPRDADQRGCDWPAGCAGYAQHATDACREDFRGLCAWHRRQASSALDARRRIERKRAARTSEVARG